jgi:hypothetical protein
VLLSAGARRVDAEGTFIPAPGRVDVVYDLKRDTLYIPRKVWEYTFAGPVLTESEVLRYHVGTRTFRDPLPIHGDLQAIDLSPDGDTLLVADGLYSEDKLWLHRVDLKTLATSRAEIAREDSYEGGTYAVAFGNDSAALVTTNFLGSGWTPLRRFDPATSAWSVIDQVRQSSMVSASADGSVIAFAEANISDGAWGRYRVLDGDVERRDGYDHGTGWFNYEIGVKNGGAQYALPTYGGTHVYNSSFGRQTIVGDYAGSQPIGQAYHPFDDVVYFAWAASPGSSVRAHRTTDLQVVAEYDFENTFDHTGNGAFNHGRLRIARDGSYLFGTVGGGVRFVRLAAHRAVAAELTVAARKNAPTVLPRASYSPTDTFRFDVVDPPVHGSLSGTGPDLIYTPVRGFVGQDRFTYRVDAGDGYSNVAAVTLLVGRGNAVPEAQDDLARTARKPINIRVLANDTDADHDRLKVSSVSTPALGRATE